MSEEQVESVQENEVNDNSQVQESEPQEDGKPPGYYPVDPKTAPPEKIEERINYLYRQVKDSSRTTHELREIAKQQSQLIDDLTQGVGQVVDHLQTKSFAETEASLEQKMLEAFESGNHKDYIKYQTQLVKLSSKPERTAQKPQEKEKPYQSAQQIASDARKDGYFTPDDERLVEAWQQETDERGNILRPWAVDKSGNPNRPDPDFVKAALIAQQVWEDNPNRTAQQNLEEVDRIMGVRKTNVNQNVMGGGLTGRQKSSNIRLTPKQQEIAVRTKFGGPGKSDADHIDAFRKQIEKVQSTKRSR